MIYRVALLILALTFWSNAQSVLEITRADEPPKIDGVMSIDEWKSAKRLEITSQIEPVKETPGTERTEVYLMYDRENLYIAFRAFDSDPSGIRAPISKRDSVSGGDDFVAIWLDTFDDRRRAYAFRFNPLGIQEDGIFSEGDRSLAWDGVYESKGIVDPEGYTVEARIPFRTLRFQINEKKSWGLHLFRSIARKKEDVSWMPISRDNPNIFSQMGELSGLDGIFAGRTLELIPTVVASNTGTREADPLAPGGARLNTVNRVEPGLTAIYQITPN
ncbi:MAG: carbohydrate binding family 9 domain-containing protein, partial [Blastocatellia bacterium]